MKIVWHFPIVWFFLPSRFIFRNSTIFYFRPSRSIFWYFTIVCFDRAALSFDASRSFISTEPHHLSELHDILVSIESYYLSEFHGSLFFARTPFAQIFRRGRNGGCPPSPAQIPACSFPALGSSEIRRFRSRNTSRVCHCHQGGWHCFSDPSPDNVSFDGYVSCQPLPHVSGFPALRVLWVDPTSYRPSVVLLLVDRPTSSWINP